MRASKFRLFKNSLPRYIVGFCTTADDGIGDNTWAKAIYRHSASEILVWILNKTGATLRKSQLVEAWRFIAKKPSGLTLGALLRAQLEDIDLQGFFLERKLLEKQDSKSILSSISDELAKVLRKKNAGISA